jgi:hypothetical protein
MRFCPPLPFEKNIEESSSKDPNISLMTLKLLLFYIFFDELTSYGLYLPWTAIEKNIRSPSVNRNTITASHYKARKHNKRQRCHLVYLILVKK